MWRRYFLILICIAIQSISVAQTASDEDDDSNNSDWEDYGDLDDGHISEDEAFLPWQNIGKASSINSFH